MREPVPLVLLMPIYLASAGLGRKIVHSRAEEVFFAQGSNCESVYYLQKCSAKLTIVSVAGNEATTSLLAAGGFVGE